jgi:uncharacterized membrane protein YphA (DoxX/SURF4 family)
VDSRRRLGGFAILALVLLRLATGWHFFTAGLEKIERDPATGGFHLSRSFAAETTGFLTHAKGPLAGFFHELAPNGHDWQTLLAVPHQNKVLTDQDAKAVDKRASYQDWQDRIVADWQAVLDKATSTAGLTEDQLQRAKKAFEQRTQELKDYLKSEQDAIAAYQHELWRLDQWRAQPEADGAPFEKERIAKKQAETTATPQPWLAQVDQLQSSFIADLRESLTPEQRADAATATSMENALAGPQGATLAHISFAATVLTLAVGICLLLGLFTRLAALAGALFLLSVIATQPPWVAGAEPTIYQTVELAGLLVLAGTGAGRWLGLDYLGWALFHRHETLDD